MDSETLEIQRNWLVHSVVNVLTPKPWGWYFHPARLEAIDQLRENAGTWGVGEEDLLDKFIQVFQIVRASIDDGMIEVEQPSSFNAHPIRLRHTDYTKARALEWNELGFNLLKEGGIDALMNHPAVMVDALGLNHWLDVGQLMIEPGYVSLERFPDTISEKRKSEILNHFGLTEGELVLFTHIKHKPGLYETGKVLGPYLDEETYKGSYRLIADFMEENRDYRSLNHHLNPEKFHPDIIFSPGSWFYDPQLENQGKGWIKNIAGNVLVLGPAADIDQIQKDFALNSSNKRKQLNEQGIYEPNVAARMINYEQILALLQPDQ